jgi:hypothetical protein
VERYTAMNKHHSDDMTHVDSKSVAACVRTLNQTIGELARRHGTTPVVAALTEVMGCSSCLGRLDRSVSIRELVKRMDNDSQ